MLNNAYVDSISDDFFVARYSKYIEVYDKNLLKLAKFPLKNVMWSCIIGDKVYASVKHNNYIYCCDLKTSQSQVLFKLEGQYIHVMKLLEVNNQLYVVYSGYNKIHKNEYLHQMILHDVNTNQILHILLPQGMIAEQNIFMFDEKLVMLSVLTGDDPYCVYVLQGTHFIESKQNNIPIHVSHICLSQNEQYVCFQEECFDISKKGTTLLKVFDNNSNNIILTYEYIDTYPLDSGRFFEYMGKTFLYFHDYGELDNSTQFMKSVRTLIYDVSSQKCIKEISGYYRIFGFSHNKIIYDMNYYGSYHPKIGIYNW